MPIPHDWIALIEACYNLDGNEQDWLTRVFEHAAPLIGRSDNQLAWTYRYTPNTFALKDFNSGCPKAFERATRIAHALSSASFIDLLYRSGLVIGTASEVIAPRFPDTYKLFVSLFGGKFPDALATGCVTGTGGGLLINTLLKQTTRTMPMERKRWTQISAHLGAGLRLHMMAEQLTLDAAPLEAIFDAGGKLYEAHEAATAKSARTRLRDAVRQIEQVRTVAGRGDIDHALDTWEGLVDGRWSLVDHFDTDGKRFVVAVKNDPAHHDPRGLSPRERQVSEYLGLGRSAKEIAYLLGVSQSAVTNCAADAQSKLGLPTLVELVAFFAPTGLRAKLAEVSIVGEQLLVGAYPQVDEQLVKHLTDIEREIVVYLVAGSTNSDIAQRRNTSLSTVASQLQKIYRKLGVRSRNELAARLQGLARFKV